jgi:hypothetical protein
MAPRAATQSVRAIPDPRQAPPDPSQLRNAQSAKGTLLGTMPVIDEEMIKKAQEQVRQGTQVSGKGGAASLPDPDKDKK